MSHFLPGLRGYHETGLLRTAAAEGAAVDERALGKARKRFDPWEEEI